METRYTIASKLATLAAASIDAEKPGGSKQRDLQRSNLFHYLQFVRTISPCFPNLLPKKGIDIILQTPTHHRGLISRIYNSFTSFNKVTLDKIRADWVEELGINISDTTWDDALCRINGSTSCAHLGLIQFKVLHLIHYSRARVSRIYL